MTHGPKCHTPGKFLELMQVQAIADDIDQARALAKDLRLTAVASALAVAWWHAENELRDELGECSSPRHVEGRCECCREFERLRSQAARWRR